MHEKFVAAVNVINSLPKTGPIDINLDKKLQFYSWYKIATYGKNDTPKPHFWELEKKLKWTAWTRNYFLNSKEAKKLYVRELVSIFKNILTSGKAEEYLTETGTRFFEIFNKDDLDILMTELKQCSTPEFQSELNILRKKYDM